MMPEYVYIVTNVDEKNTEYEIFLDLANSVFGDREPAFNIKIFSSSKFMELQDNDMITESVKLIFLHIRDSNEKAEVQQDIYKMLEAYQKKKHLEEKSIKFRMLASKKLIALVDSHKNGQPNLVLIEQPHKWAENDDQQKEWKSLITTELSDKDVTVYLLSTINNIDGTRNSSLETIKNNLKNVLNCLVKRIREENTSSRVDLHSRIYEGLQNSGAVIILYQPHIVLDNNGALVSPGFMFDWGFIHGNYKHERVIYVQCCPENGIAEMHSRILSSNTTVLKMWEDDFVIQLERRLRHAHLIIPDYITESLEPEISRPLQDSKCEYEVFKKVN